MVEGSTTVTVSVISGGQNPGIPESEMDALLLGRTKVSCKTLSIGERQCVVVLP